MKKLSLFLLVYFISFQFSYGQKNNKNINSNNKKLAIVIGNANYAYYPQLEKTVNDANSMQNSLLQLGFVVDKQIDVDVNDLDKVLDDFYLKLKGSDIGLLYYSGHGVKVARNDYILPIDSKFENEEQLKQQCVSITEIITKMDSSGCDVKIVILDCSRDNPNNIEGEKSFIVALSNLPSNIFLAYATGPGSISYKGSGTNSLYTSSLLKYIKTSNIPINELFKLVRKTVYDKSENRQIPWETSTLEKDFYFFKCD